ncbi:long-chain fatty acid--CoA ligase [Streptomyces sp. B6B3]|uniref:acyl-CoA synthetase n=1 Tax=Streptomyces sp. B6B3 TaxID=3153570 RepID=UPI00325DB9EB
MRNEGLGSWPARRARMTPRRTALVHLDRRISYAELHERTTRLAHALRGLGVCHGDRVAYLGPNHPSFLETLFATSVLGAVFVGLNTRLTAREIAHQLDDSGSGVLVYAASHAPLVAELRGTDTGVRTFLGVGSEYESLLAAAPTEPIDEWVRRDDTCLIMYTSGTTGLPKGAMLTHGNLIWNAINALIDLDLTADERALAVAPLFHCAGLNMLTLPVLLKGGTCVLVESFDPDAVLDLIQLHRITFMFGVPTMFDLMASHARWPYADLSSLRTLTCGGARLPTPLIATYRERGLALQQGYGMTETAPGALLLDREHAVAKAGSAGVPHFFTEIRVVRPDLTPVRTGETGEVQISGPNVMPGYWQQPEGAEACFAEDGWFRSGDVARVDDDGYVYIVDRIKDVIISGGENVYPAEIENLLLAHPDVADCVVIGTADPRWGEVPRAVVVPRAGANLDPVAVLASLSGRLARYKIPKSVVIVGELPRTATGKLLRPRVRDLYGTR